MKKNLFYFALGALALTACTSEDVVTPQKSSRNVIGFENVANKFSRSAEDLTKKTLTKFHVFGFYTTPDNNLKAVEVFNNTPVTNISDSWDYVTEAGEYRYWVPNGHYYFYAYSCGSVSKLDSAFGEFKMDMADGKTPAERVLKIENYLCDATHQHDLVYASNTGATNDDIWAGIIGKTTGNDFVSLQFEHLLSKVTAKFTNKFPAGYTAEISNVTISGINNIADYNQIDGWHKQGRSGGAEPGVFLLYTNPNDETADAPIAAATGESVSSESAYVIPFAPTDEEVAADPSQLATIKFTLTVYNGEEQIMVKELKGQFKPTWEKGYSYLYSVELSGSTSGLEVIAFTVTTDREGNIVTGWGDGSGSITIQ